MRIYSPAVARISGIIIDANIPMATYKLTGLGAGSGAGHSLQYQQAIKAALLTTQGDLLIRGASAAERLAKIPTGLFLKATATGYEGSVEGISQIVPKTADQIVNNSTALVNDDHFVLPVGANEVWFLLLYLRGFGPTTTTGIDSAWSLPSGGSILRFNSGWAATGGIAEYNWTSEFNSTLSLSVDAYKSQIIAALYIGGATAGNAQFQWAQRVATAVNTTLKENSSIIAFKLR